MPLRRTLELDLTWKCFQLTGGLTWAPSCKISSSSCLLFRRSVWNNYLQRNFCGLASRFFCSWTKFWEWLQKDPILKCRDWACSFAENSFAFRILDCGSIRMNPLVSRFHAFSSVSAKRIVFSRKKTFWKFYSLLATLRKWLKMETEKNTQSNCMQFHAWQSSHQWLQELPGTGAVDRASSTGFLSHGRFAILRVRPAVIFPWRQDSIKWGRSQFENAINMAKCRILHCLFSSFVSLAATAKFFNICLPNRQTARVWWFGRNGLSWHVCCWAFWICIEKLDSSTLQCFLSRCKVQPIVPEHAALGKFCWRTSTKMYIYILPNSPQVISKRTKCKLSWNHSFNFLLTQFPYSRVLCTLLLILIWAHTNQQNHIFPTWHSCFVLWIKSDLITVAFYLRLSSWMLLFFSRPLIFAEKCAEWVMSALWWHTKWIGWLYATASISMASQHVHVRMFLLGCAMAANSSGYVR